ncbi:MAG: radical SAM protein [Defluviitaleaceae bacterium]|nr:radical SAM protein [Defluviitaleaceae bacterium]
MMNNDMLIFYGAGIYAAINLPMWEAKGLTPLCFADADTRKHYTKLMDIFGGYTPYDILPLQEAINRYPNYHIYVTVARDKLTEVTNYLMDKQIPQERIKYMDSLELRYGCHSLGRVFQCWGSAFKVCANAYRPEGLFSEGTMKAGDNFNMHKILVENRINTLRANKSASCEGCRYLEKNFWESTVPQIDLITISSIQGSDWCNFKCIYCETYPKPENKAHRQRFSAVMDTLTNFIGVSKKGKINIASGEPVINFTPLQLKKIIELVRSNDRQINFATNASLYSTAIAEALTEGFATITISIDAGMRETFYKVRGVDCFEKVIKNIKRYAQSNKNAVIIKYIVLTGLNDNETDINGFLDIATELNLPTPITITGMYNAISLEPATPLPEKTLLAVEYLLKQCKKRGLEYNLIKNEYFTTDDIEIIKNFEERY